MRKYFDFVEGTDGRAVRGASVRVTTYPADVLATLYADSGAVTPLANPLTTDGAGYYEFYIADGHYTIRVDGAGLAEQAVQDVVIYDPTNVLSGLEAAQDAADAAAASASSASTSATTAQNWATQTSSEVVVGQGYGAKKYAQDANASAGAAATSATNAAASESNAQLLMASVRFATKATMDANLAYAAGTFAAVYADSTSSNNGLYYKVGASGAGSWTAYQGDRMTVIENQTANYRAAGDPIGVEISTTETDWAHAYTDPLGKVAGGVKDDGTLDFGAIKARTSLNAAGATTASDAQHPEFAHVVSQDSAGNVALGVLRNGKARLKLDTKDCLPPFTLPYGGPIFPAQIVYSSVSGQSNGVGAPKTSGTLTASRQYDNIQFTPLSTSPTVFDLAYNLTTEHSGFGASITYKQIIAEKYGISYSFNDYQLCCTMNAVSAQGIDALAKGGSTGAYEKMLSQVTSGYTLAASLGKTFVATDEEWIHGEADNGMVAATYASKMKSRVDVTNTDVKAATGQKTNWHMLSWQVCSNASPTVALGQLQASEEHPLIHLVVPAYIFDYSDFQHINAASQRWLGTYMGLAREAIISSGGKKFEPLKPVFVQIVGNNIDVTFNKDGLAFDTTIVPAQTNYGFSVENASAVAQTINSVTLMGQRRVRFAMASTPAAGWHLKYAHNACTGKSPFVGGAGNLRDTQTFVDPNGKTTHNWCVMFDWTI